MPTVRDIAKRAQVSVATVSRVLNNHPSVNESTRFAVLQAAQELDYPLENLRAKPQIGRSVLVLTREEYNAPASDGRPGMREFERAVWGGVHDVLDAHGLAARLQQTRQTPDEASRFVDDVSVAGLILLGGVANPAFVERLTARRVPAVIVGSNLTDLRVNSVMADVGGGIRCATTHLIHAGRRRIGLVNGPESTRTTPEKLDGYRLTLHLHDLPFRPEAVVNADFTAEDGYRQTRDLLERAPDLDALLYAEDTAAMGGLRALKELGRAVPGDIAVIGFGNYDIAQYTHPALSSVAFDMRLMGRIAAKRLAMLLRDEGDADAWLVRVPCALVTRESA